jgi:hypothetical protein
MAEELLLDELPADAEAGFAGEASDARNKGAFKVDPADGDC